MNQFRIEDVIEHPNRYVDLILKNLNFFNPEQREKLQHKFQRLLAEELELPRKEQNKIFVEKYKESLSALGEKNNHSGEFNFPGPLVIVEKLKAIHTYHTLRDSSDKEPVYQYDGRIYVRAEESLKQEAHDEFLRQWKEILTLVETKPTDGQTSFTKKLYRKLKAALTSGPSLIDINEVLAMVRRTTYVDSKTMNPDTHIPFLNGLLNLATWKLEPFSPELFFTFLTEANYRDNYVTLLDTPMFSQYLHDVFYNIDIPMVLSHMAYDLYPGFPVHRVLLVLGRERIGKGVQARILKGLLGTGYGSIELHKLLLADRFQFVGILGKNLLVDTEIRRNFRRGQVKDWKSFNSLFGDDVVQYEPKGKDAYDYVSKAKGLFLGNLPFFGVDNPAAVARMDVVETKDERKSRAIPKLHEKILAGERDQISTMLIQVLRKLMDREWIFPGQLAQEGTAEVLDRLADPVENFIEEETESMDGSEVNVDTAYDRFCVWCKGKGITVLARQTFVKNFGYTYPKRRRGTSGNRYYAFTGCIILTDDVKSQGSGTLLVGREVNARESRENGSERDRWERVQHA